MNIHGKLITRAEIMLIASDGTRFQDVADLDSWASGLIVDEKCYYLREKDRKQVTLNHYLEMVEKLKKELENSNESK